MKVEVVLERCGAILSMVCAMLLGVLDKGCWVQLITTEYDVLLVIEDVDCDCDGGHGLVRTRLIMIVMLMIRGGLLTCIRGYCKAWYVCIFDSPNN